MKFKVVYETDKPFKFCFVSDGTVTYELIEADIKSDGAIDHVAYVSTDINADYNHYKRLGLISTELSFMPELFGNGAHYFFIKGADGVRIEFSQKA